MNLAGVVDFWHRLNWVDFVIVVMTLRTIYVGARRGFIPELTMLLGILAALIVSLQHAGSLSLLLSKAIHIPTEWLRTGLVGALFMATYFLFRLLRIGMSKLFHLEAASGLNQWGGALIGLLRGVFTTSLLLLVLLKTPTAVLEREIKEKSFSGLYVVQAALAIYEACVQIYPFRTTEGAGSLTVDL